MYSDKKGMIIIMPKSKVTNCNDINLKKVFTIECKDIVLREFQLEDLDAIYKYYITAWNSRISTWLDSNKGET